MYTIWESAFGESTSEVGRRDVIQGIEMEVELWKRMRLWKAILPISLIC